jgi:hypothetical protein
MHRICTDGATYPQGGVVGVLYFYVILGGGGGLRDQRASSQLRAESWLSTLLGRGGENWFLGSILIADCVGWLHDGGMSSPPKLLARAMGLVWLLARAMWDWFGCLVSICLVEQLVTWS